MKKAKYSAGLMTAHCGMNIISLFNETFQGDAMPVGRDAAAQLLVPVRSDNARAATADLLRPQEHLDRDGRLHRRGFARQFQHRQGVRRLHVPSRRRRDHGRPAWIPGKTEDGIVDSESDVTIPGVTADEAWVVDVFNGTRPATQRCERRQRHSAHWNAHQGLPYVS